MIMPRKPAQKSKSTPAILPSVDSMIHVVRGQKVMLDSDLAMLYGVKTGNLNQAVKRNQKRFPHDFMFSLLDNELRGLILQSAISNEGRGGRQKSTTVYTELGVAMLSSVLGSERAVQMNIAIMRAFVKMREVLATNKDLAARMEKIERKQDRTASVIEVLVEDIDRIGHEVKKMKQQPTPSKRNIGFELSKKKR